MKVKFLGLLILFLFAVSPKLPQVSFSASDTFSLGHPGDLYVVADSDGGFSSPKTFYKILFFLDLDNSVSRHNNSYLHLLVNTRFHVSHLLGYVVSGAILFHQTSTSY